MAATLLDQLQKASYFWRLLTHASDRTASITRYRGTKSTGDPFDHQFAASSAKSTTALHCASQHWFTSALNCARNSRLFSFGPVLWSLVTFGKFLSPDLGQQGQQLLRSRWAITPSKTAPSTGHSGPTSGRSGSSPGHTGPSSGHHRAKQWPFGSWPLGAFARPLRVFHQATQNLHQATQGSSPCNGL